MGTYGDEKLVSQLSNIYNLSAVPAGMGHSVILPVNISVTMVAAAGYTFKDIFTQAYSLIPTIVAKILDSKNVVFIGSSFAANGSPQSYIYLNAVGVAVTTSLGGDINVGLDKQDTIATGMSFVLDDTYTFNGWMLLFKPNS